MARTIVGAAYNPDFLYDLETTAEGFSVITTNTLTGEVSSYKLEEEHTPEPDPSYPDMWDRYLNAEPPTLRASRHEWGFWVLMGLTITAGFLYIVSKLI